MLCLMGMMDGDGYFDVDGHKDDDDGDGDGDDGDDHDED